MEISKKMKEAIWLETMDVTLTCDVAGNREGKKIRLMSRNFDGTKYGIEKNPEDLGNLHWMSFEETLASTSARINSVQIGVLEENPEKWIFKGFIPSENGKDILPIEVTIGEIIIVGGIGWVDMSIKKYPFSRERHFFLKKKIEKKIAEVFSENVEKKKEIEKLFILTDARSEDDEEASVIKISKEDKTDDHNVCHHGASF